MRPKSQIQFVPMPLAGLPLFYLLPFCHIVYSPFRVPSFCQLSHCKRPKQVTSYYKTSMFWNPPPYDLSCQWDVKLKLTKFWDRQVNANIADPDQTACDGYTVSYIHCHSIFSFLCKFALLGRTVQFYYNYCNNLGVPGAV